MYQSLLTRRYLTHKIMPWLAMVAVMLCSGLVLTTWSIMGGFLVMLLDIGRKMEGDVTINWPTVGFAYYDDLITRLEADPMIEAAAPVIQSFGMVNLPDNRVLGVQIRGVDERYAKVTAYAESLWWKPLERPMPKDRERHDPRLDPTWALRTQDYLNSVNRAEIAPSPLRTWDRLYADGLRLAVDDQASGGGGQPKPAAVLGIELSGMAERNREGEGWYEASKVLGTRDASTTRFDKLAFAPAHSVTINVLPLDRKGRSISVVSRRLPVANEFRTGFYESDNKTVLMNLAELQRMLKLDAGERLVNAPLDPYKIEGSGTRESTPRPQVLGIDPARVTSVFVKGKPGTTTEETRARCELIWDHFARAHPGEVPDLEAMTRSRTISTWERSMATFVGAVEKETAIVLGMLLFISFVCVFLILAIFWSMVSEKTKDIGVLRSIGGSKPGVAWLWLRYGLTIGIVGAIAGGTLAFVIVTNINPIHEWLGRNLNLTLWDPKVYYFPEIPHDVEPLKATIVLVGGVLFSVMGALIPAVKAARMDPVKALRFE